jgi:ATP-dependent RNA helicase HelY
VELPSPYLPNNHNFHRQVAERLLRAPVKGDGVAAFASDGKRAARAMQLAAERDGHPVASCPDARGHVLALRRVQQREREVMNLERQIRGRSESLARQFDRVLRVLEAWGYVDGWSLTPAGERLVAIFHECDLLIAEVLRSGLLDDLTVPEVAALVSTLTYEMRGPGTPPTPTFPTGALRLRWADLEYIARELNLAEEDAGLPLTRRPDPGFVGLAYDWARGEDLSRVIEDDAMTGGDFVRNVKQLIDLLRQLGDAAENPETGRTCRQAAEALFRGVVAASSVVSA